MDDTVLVCLFSRDVPLVAGALELAGAPGRPAVLTQAERVVLRSVALQLRIALATVQHSEAGRAGGAGAAGGKDGS